MNGLINRKNIYIVVFLISLSAMLGSLYFSEILGLAPCELCWYQRILMYPIVLLSGVALYRKSKEVVFYALPLSVIGIFISGYQYALQMMPKANEISGPCSATGPACSGIYLQYFGFITIPFMSMLAFVVISVLLYISIRIDR